MGSAHSQIGLSADHEWTAGSAGQWLRRHRLAVALDARGRDSRPRLNLLPPQYIIYNCIT